MKSATISYSAFLVGVFTGTVVTNAHAAPHDFAVFGYAEAFGYRFLHSVKGFLGSPSRRPLKSYNNANGYKDTRNYRNTQESGHFVLRSSAEPLSVEGCPSYLRSIHRDTRDNLCPPSGSREILGITFAS